MNTMIIVEKYKQAVAEMFRQVFEQRNKIKNFRFESISLIDTRLKSITRSVNKKYPRLIVNDYVKYTYYPPTATLYFTLSDGKEREYEFNF